MRNILIIVMLGVLQVVYLCGVAGAQVVLPAAPGGVQVTRDYGIEFSTITHPGNAGYAGPWNTPEVHPPRGGVEYEYRISRTELTVGQWFEFVQAYKPHFQGTARDRLTLQAGWIDFNQSSGEFSYDPQFENFAATPSWNDAARFCNWLHNGKVNAAWAFENGAYDMSTMSTGLGQPIRDQATRSPGSRFWIPSQSEWLKAAYWDPNKNGQGQGGYWAWPNASDTPPVSGPPTREGATTNASAVPGDDGTWSPVMPVAQYLQSQSPWGLFDISGGESEWTEDFWNNGLPFRQVLGSSRGSVSSFDDPIATNATALSNTLPYSTPVTSGGSPWGNHFGFRLVAEVPNMPTAACLAAAVFVCIRKRRRSFV